MSPYRRQATVPTTKTRPGDRVTTREVLSWVLLGTVALGTVAMLFSAPLGRVDVLLGTAAWNIGIAPKLMRMVLKESQ